MGISSMQAAKAMCECSGWTLDGPRLQKILYFTHMVFMGRHGGMALIYGENFHARKYGPVLPSIYFRTRCFGARPIKDAFPVTRTDTIGKREIRVVKEAVNTLGKVDLFGLSRVLCDEESAWLATISNRAKHDIEQGIVIPNARILFEYKHRWPRVNNTTPSSKKE